MKKTYQRKGNLRHNPCKSTEKLAPYLTETKNGRVGNEERQKRTLGAVQKKALAVAVAIV